MPVLNETELVQFNDWTLRIRPAAATPARLLLMIHGWTGDENSMWIFSRELPAHYWLLAPRAPHVTDPSGYSWRPHTDGEMGSPGIELLQPAVTSLLKLVDEYSASVELDAHTFDVIGFSQGAALGALMTMMHPDRVGKLGILSGFVPRGSKDLIAAQPLKERKIFVSHGTDDTLVPVDRARQGVAALEKAGAEVIYCEDRVGHKVSVSCMRALRSYLQD